MSPEYKERERLTWAERDKRKNRSPHVRQDPVDYRPAYEQKRAMSNYKQKLEALFTPGKKTDRVESPEMKKIRETSDRTQFIELADAYIAAHGLPTAWEDLENFLRHKTSEVLSETIRRMEVLLPEQSEIRKGNFQKDLHLIEMTTRDKELRKQVSQVLKSLNAPAAP